MLIQCDFDGTIIRNNLSVLLRENFAQGDWRQIEDAYMQRSLTVEESNRQQYRLIYQSREKLQAFVCQHIELRPGFIEFVSYCQQENIPFVIVSSGVDFYIKAVLDRIGMSHLEHHCGRGVFYGDGISVQYFGPEGNLLDGGFKSRFLTWLRQRDSSIIYLGDGYSDIEPARQAEHVLATGMLPDLLKAESVATTAFDDFYEVISEVKRLSQQY